jgi:hypothetical protein
MDCCQTILNAALNGHFECLKNKHSQGGELSPLLTYYIVGKENLECLKYLHSQGCEWHEWTTTYAAETGNLEILKYVHENGCPWDNFTTSKAVKCGHLEILKYAHENGCPWDDKTDSIAATHFEIDCLIYCLENKCPIHLHTLNIIDRKYDYESITNNLIDNIKLRKLLLHPKFKEIKNEFESSKKYKYLYITEYIKEYEEFINKISQLLKSETNLPTDVIKYEIIKYI